VDETLIYATETSAAADGGSHCRAVLRLSASLPRGIPAGVPSEFFGWPSGLRRVPDICREYCRRSCHPTPNRNLSGVENAASSVSTPEQCETYFVKDLKKVKRLGFNLDQVIIVEDTQAEGRTELRANAIYVRSFCGDVGDDELRRLATYLDRIKTSINVRGVEKRDWRLQVTL